VAVIIASLNQVHSFVTCTMLRWICLGFSGFFDQRGWLISEFSLQPMEVLAVNCSFLRTENDAFIVSKLFGYMKVKVPCV
jgi:hypothetical protein